MISSISLMMILQRSRSSSRRYLTTSSSANDIKKNYLLNKAKLLLKEKQQRQKLISKEVVDDDYEVQLCSSTLVEDSSIEGTKKKKKKLEIAIVGAPNAGKSQLLNTLVKTHLAAVSRKRHTTRTSILGIRTINDTQLVFIDTPGYLRTQSAKKEKLMRDLMVTASSEMGSSDYSLVVVDSAKRVDEEMRSTLAVLMLQAARSSLGEFAILLNKVDLVNPKVKLLPLAEEMLNLSEVCKADAHEENPQIDKDNPCPVFFISALEDDGVNDVVNLLLSKAKPGEWQEDGELVSDMSNIERVTEIIREKIYRTVHKEVPHQAKQFNEYFDEGYLKNNKTGERHKILQIGQVIVVNSKSHLRILQGKAGKTLNRIIEQARQDISVAFDNVEVDLQIRIKLSKNQNLADGENPHEPSLHIIEQGNDYGDNLPSTLDSPKK